MNEIINSPDTLPCGTFSAARRRTEGPFQRVNLSWSFGVSMVFGSWPIISMFSASFGVSPVFRPFVINKFPASDICALSGHKVGMPYAPW